MKFKDIIYERPDMDAVKNQLIDFTKRLKDASSYEEAKKAKVPFHGGNILAADVFYDPDPQIWNKWAALGVMGVEMESYSLYVNAARFNKKALCLLTVTDSFISHDQKLSSEERAFGLGRMIELAIATGEHYCD